MLQTVASAKYPAPSEEAFAACGPEVAVLLNANARSVNAQVRRALSLVLPDEHLFFSTTHEEASAIAEEVVSRRYGTVFTGGGDGTFVGWVNRILESAERRSARPPRFGVLALGTGNAVAEMVGATPRRHAQDLARYVRGEVGTVRRLDLLTCDGRRTPFAGAGIDAAVLNDYVWLKRRLAGTPLARLGVGATGYGLAIALRSAPRALLRETPVLLRDRERRPACVAPRRQRRPHRPPDRARRAPLRRPLHARRREHRPVLRPRAPRVPVRRASPTGRCSSASSRASASRRSS